MPPDYDIINSIVGAVESWKRFLTEVGFFIWMPQCAFLPKQSISHRFREKSNFGELIFLMIDRIYINACCMVIIANSLISVEIAANIHDSAIVRAIKMELFITSPTIQCTIFVGLKALATISSVLCARQMVVSFIPSLVHNLR